MNLASKSCTSDVRRPLHGKVAPLPDGWIFGTSKRHRLSRPSECGLCLAKFYFPPSACVEMSMLIAPQVREFGPVILQQRVFRGGQIKWLPKLRYMSNEPSGLQITRVQNSASAPWRLVPVGLSPLGTFLKRWWMDESLQLYSWLVGDLKFIGPRPKLPAEFKELKPVYQARLIQHKPGWMNVLCAFRPGTVRTPEEKIAAEMCYLDEYAQSPWRTDAKYTVRALFNIVFRGLRGT